MKKLVGFIRRADGGIFGEVYKTEEGFEVLMVEISTREFRNLEQMKNEQGLGGWLYDFEVRVKGKEI